MIYIVILMSFQTFSFINNDYIDIEKTRFRFKISDTLSELTVSAFAKTLMS